MSKTAAARTVYPNDNAEVQVEARIAAIESDVSHIKTDLVEMKVDIRELRSDVKAANEAIASLRTESARQYAELKGDNANLRTEMTGELHRLRGSQRLAIATNTIGQLLTAAAILGIVGRALKWF